MDSDILFVGEKRSNLAKQLRLRWEHGGLAAKPLFEALRAINIDPTTCMFCNWFEGGKTKVRSHKGLVVALGRKVERALVNEGITHIFLVHPAARGSIRKREKYITHVKERLILASVGDFVIQPKGTEAPYDYFPKSK